MIWKENGYFRIKRIIEIIFYYVKSFEKKKKNSSEAQNGNNKHFRIIRFVLISRIQYRKDTVHKLNVVRDLPFIQPSRR